MRYLMAVLAACFAVPASADAVARIGNDWVRITARPCANEAVLQQIPDVQARLDFRAATAHFQGKDYAACWTPVPGGVAVLYEDGDQGAIPAGELKPVPEA